MKQSLESSKSEHQHQQDRSANEKSNTNRQSHAHNNHHRRHHSSRSTIFEQLVEACKRKDLASIRSIVGGRPELINKRDKLDRNLLHYTVIIVTGDEPRNATKFSVTGKSSSEERQADDEQLEAKSLDCFNYLTDRCDIKLWWQQDCDGLSVLHLAVISSNVTLVRHLIYEHPYSTKYPLVCTLDNEHHSPLHWAVITNNLECVRLLINYAGVKLAHEPDLNGATPLHYATQINDYPKYRQQLRDMLRSVSNSTQIIQSLTSMDSVTSATDGQSELSQSGKLPAKKLSRQQTSASMEVDQVNGGYEVLEYLVRLPQVNLECLDKDRRTPLLWAASSGCREAIVLLVSRGANINCYDVNRLSPLHCAASHGFTDCLECLLNLSQGSSHSGLAASSGQVNQSDNLNCTPLFYSVLSGNIDCIELLLDRGAKCDWQDAKGRTAAHFAALKGQLNSLKLLQDRGANLWLPNKQGDLPLHYAIKSGRQQVVRWLLENSPYERAVNAINNFGRAPIHLAVMKDNSSMADFLIGCGANLNQLVKVRDKISSSRSQGNVSSSSWSQASELNDVTAAAAAPPATQSQVVAHHQAKNGASYHYETAMDMASKMGHHDCLKLLIAHGALPAAKVLAERQSNSKHQQQDNQRVLGNSMSLFDLQSVDGPSPIGFDTSSSSASTQVQQQQQQPPTTPQQVSSTGSGVPRLTRPTPDSLPTTDSTGSSALSQNSMTSIRGVSQQTSGGRAARVTRQPSQSVDRDQQQLPPYKGGISYSNDLMDASIKCRVHTAANSGAAHQLHHHKSFPQTNHQLSQRVRMPGHTTSGKTSRSAEASGFFGSQEIVTNVNVYTSPCAHCMHNKQGDSCVECSSPANQQVATATGGKSQDRAAAQAQRAELSEDDSDLTSDLATGGESEPETQQAGRDNLPPLSSRQMSESVNHGAKQTTAAYAHPRPTMQMRHLPPSQGYEQHLPVILSEQERSTSATSNEQSPLSARGDQTEPSLAVAPEEPRFDRAQRSPSRRVDKYREYVRSPVADYIHSGGGYPTATSLANNEHQRSGVHMDQHQHQPVRVDYSQVRPKVDSRWSNGQELPTYEDYRPKSMSNVQGATAAGSRGPTASDSGIQSHSTATLDRQRGQYGGQIGAQPEGHQSRSVSRQTIIKTRRLSVDSVELATKIEKSIRKYRQETKLFEELQNLKRSQIRSGRANEALLVKRLIEHFSNEVAPLDLLEPYHGPYTYKSYERFLYDQLRKLSQSNQAKLSKVLTEDQLEAYTQQRDLYHHQLQRQLDEMGERNFSDEDLRAELELRQVIDRDSDSASLILETSGALEDIRVKGKSGDAMNDLGSAPLNQQVDRELIEHNRHEKLIDDDHEAVEVEEEPKIGGGQQSLAEERTKTKPNVRRASVSSVSSSRRSSVDIEREKILSLPLRVESSENLDQGDNANEEADGDEIRQLVAEQADSMANSIVVDALGNVSRAGSARSANFKSSSMVESASLVDDKDETELEGEEKPRSEPLRSPPVGASGRRRSVVNIGDKLEVIYHNVGIEIDQAPDQQPEEDHIQTKESTSATSEETVEAVKSEGEDKVSQSRKFSRVEEEQEGGELDETVEASDLIEANKQPEAEDTEAAFPTVNAPAPNQKGGQLGQLVSAAGRRRVSSPPTMGKYGSVERSSGSMSQDSAVPMKKRSQSIGRQQFVEQQLAETRKVFTGYDLDEMRAGRQVSRKSTGGGDDDEVVAEQQRQKSIEKSSSVEEQETVKVMDKQMSDEGAEVARVLAKGDKLEGSGSSQGSRQSSFGDRATDEGFISRSTIHRSSQRIEQLTPLEGRESFSATSGGASKQKPKMERSHIPKGKYVIQVPIGEIQARWSHIKGRERFKRQLQDSADLKQQHHHQDQEPVQLLWVGVGEHHQANGLGVERQLAAKSQPNLDELTMRGADSSSGGLAQNYILLYEINKHKQQQVSELRSQTASAAKRPKGDSAAWCQRRAIRIVDVRSLKRTLSLPESLIYSNDLLKKFNILKL